MRAGCITLAVIFMLSLLPGCGGLPERSAVMPSHAIQQNADTIAGLLQEDADDACTASCSSLALLNRGDEALRWRLALIEMARESLDLQYYIWENDESGRLLFARLLEAADRGVRVRILYDDTAVLGRETNAAMVNYHPNLEIRTFNPFSARGSFFTLLDGLFNLERLNQRMHNKLLVADNVMAITGGRNIGNKYFGLDDKMNFRDMDVMVLGPSVVELSHSFDEFWNSRWSYPPEAFVGRFDDEKTFQKARASFAKKVRNDRARLGRLGLTSEIWAQMRHDIESKAVHAPVRVLSDQAELEIDDGRELVFRAISDISRRAAEEAFIVSPYFIPTTAGVEALAKDIENGLRITVLTNSLSSNDVTATNAAYKHYRKPLVEAGVELYELRGDARARNYYRSARPAPRWLGLHAKVMVYDRKNVFIGSLNLDPRSVLLNTELGLLIESPELARQVLEAFRRDLHPDNSWQVGLDEANRLYWESTAGRVFRQPARNAWQRFKDWLIPGLLIEHHL